MRIHVQSLPFDQDFTTEFKVQTDTFIDDPKSKAAGIRFPDPVDCKATLRKLSGEEITLQLRAITWVEANCDRCAESYRMPITVEIDLMCRPMSFKPTGEEIEDEGLVYFTKNEINLDQIVREQILLNMPMKFVCDENCQGLCPACGENLNNGQHLCLREPVTEYKAKVL